ncbi:MAG: hypothetical protein QM784_39435 [Polyangiaceae bacterium]
MGAGTQYAQTGRVNWGWRGVAGATVAGTVGAGVGMGVSSLATGVLGSSAGGAAVGGAVGGASGGALGSAFTGSNGYGIATAALSGAVSGAVGGAVGVAAGSKSGGWTGFGGVMAGTGAGTVTGVAFNAGILGQDSSIGSIGTALRVSIRRRDCECSTERGVDSTNGEEDGGRGASLQRGRGWRWYRDYGRFNYPRRANYGSKNQRTYENGRIASEDGNDGRARRRIYGDWKIERARQQDLP